MLFRVIKGAHSQDGQLYEAGTDHEVVDTSIDLIKAFNNNGKFERVSVPLDELNVQAAVVFENDVTEQFDVAAQVNCKVYRESGQFFIVNNDTNQPIHKTKLTSMETVRQLLIGLK